jgi:hypothetical protein
MTTLEHALETISKLNIDASKGLEQFSPEEIEACETATQAIVDFNFHGAPKPDIPEGALVNLRLVQDMQLSGEAEKAVF